jgi:hypothetical protein
MNTNVKKSKYKKKKSEIRATIIQYGRTCVLAEGGGMEMPLLLPLEVLGVGGFFSSNKYEN